jgi:thymidylate synthase ThyX
MAPEKSAYALARYSRSPDSIVRSLEWVRTHDSQSFLEHYYFQYGHASIADLGHAIFCFEGVSELAAIEIEDEPLWDGQAKSSRYQNFSAGGAVAPPEVKGTPAEAVYCEGARGLLQAYQELHGRVFEYLAERNPRPEAMKPEAYRRTIAARAYDVARYLLPLGIPTNVGQVTSIRTLEKQIRRLGASPYAEVREIADEMKEACATPPDCVWEQSAPAEPLAPTLARHAEPDWAAQQARTRLAAWAAENLPSEIITGPAAVDLVHPREPLDEIVATLLYPSVHLPFREIYEQVSGWSAARKREVIEVALEGRASREELLREFRSGYAFLFDIVTDIGAYRDLHRHRRCQQLRQELTFKMGAETPRLINEAGLGEVYGKALTAARSAAARVAQVSQEASRYLLPFAVRLRCLFKMDFAEAEYIARVRSGVKGHFSYRDIAWKMKEQMVQSVPELGRLVEATPPWVEDTLKR